MSVGGQPFGATDAPDTCLWCGRPLRWVTTADFERVESPAGQHCERATGSRSRIFKRRGGYGDGLFCGLRCGFQFGHSMARTGRRIK